MTSNKLEHQLHLYQRGYDQRIPALEHKDDLIVDKPLFSQAQPSFEDNTMVLTPSGSNSFLQFKTRSAVIQEELQVQEHAHPLYDSGAITQAEFEEHRSIDRNKPINDQRLSAVHDVDSTDFDRGLGTRNLCILALVVGWLVSFAALALGIYIIVIGPIQVPAFLLDRTVAVGTVQFSWVTASEPSEYNPYLADHRVYQVSEAVMIMIGLLLTFALTVLLESINFVHSTALRWALWREGRLINNNNLRLITFAKHHLPTGWAVGIISGLGLTITYGGITLLTFDVYIIAQLVLDGNNASFNPDVPGPRHAIDFNAWGLLGVGFGIFLQAAVSTSCLIFTRGIVATWSSNPMTTAKACKFTPQVYETHSHNIPKPPQQSHVEMSTSDSNTAFPKTPEDSQFMFQSNRSLHNSTSSTLRSALSRPRTKQRSALFMVRHARQIARWTWVFFALACLLVLIVACLGTKYKSLNASFVEQASGRLDFLAYVQSFGQISIYYTDNPYTKRREWLGLIIQSLILSLSLINLHLIEYLTLLIRDEKIWRQATARNGVELDSSPFVHGFSIWQCWVLGVSKSTVPWVFSYAFSCNTAVFINLVPWAILAILYLLLTLFSEGLVRWKPKGTQPATYGNIHDLLSLVDDWDHKILFWGHKGYSDGIGKAGTCGSRLADVKQGILYTGLRGRLDRFA